MSDSSIISDKFEILQLTNDEIAPECHLIPIEWSIINKVSSLVFTYNHKDVYPSMKIEKYKQRSIIISN